MKKEHCYLNDEPLHQCCCNCVFLHPVHYHCCTEPVPPLETHPNTTCCCGVRKGWACMPPGFDGVVYDNWPEHSVGCEMHETKADGAKEGE